MKKVLGWHFAKEDNCLNFKDGREIIIGETHSISTKDTDLSLCNWGLHASRRIIDSLSYSPGPIIYRVELSGEIIADDDKMVATHRKYLWGFDATDLLYDFSRRCALDVIHLWNAPYVVIEYLKTGNANLRQAAYNASASASASAWGSAWGSARASASASARASASASAWGSASARASASASAWGSASARASASASARASASASAWGSASASALNKFNRRLTSMVAAEHKRLSK